MRIEDKLEEIHSSAKDKGHFLIIIILLILLSKTCSMQDDIQIIKKEIIEIEK